MKKQYGAAVRHLFKQALKNNNIQLVKYKPTTVLIEPGERVYMTKIGSLSCFVILILHPMAEKFTLEIGWSEKNSFPSVSIRPSGFLSSDKKELNQGDFIFRVGDLLGRSDFWWTVEESPMSVDDIVQSMEKLTKEIAETKVLPQIEDATKKLMYVVMPFFKELYTYKNAAGAVSQGGRP